MRQLFVDAAAGFEGPLRSWADPRACAEQSSGAQLVHVGEVNSGQGGKRPRGLLIRLVPHWKLKGRHQPEACA